MGSVTFQVDITHPRSSSIANRPGCGTAWGKSAVNATTPVAMIVAT
jgi:hypothetical protein